MSENKEQNIIDRAVVFFKRQLTLLQKIYLNLFSRLLNKYKVESPADLSEEVRALFFQELEEATREEHERLVNDTEEVPQKTKKELYYEVEATRPSVPIDIDVEELLSEPDDIEQEVVTKLHQDDASSPNEDQVKEEIGDYSTSPELENDKEGKKTSDSNKQEDELGSLIDKRNMTPGRRSQDKGTSGKKSITKASSNLSDKPISRNNNNEEDKGVTTIVSRINLEQSDDLRIGYHPNSFFKQAVNHTYPVVKMPKEGAYLKLPRLGRAQGKGYKEHDFHQAILTNIPDIEVAVDVHMRIPYFNKPYEPDIVLINRALNLYIDIEIDEPYDGYYRFPTHETEKDDTRDLFFTESGWVVIRFTERQVHLQEKQCIAYIKDVLNSICNYRFAETSNCISEPQWDYQQAVRWEKEHYREKYLGIERFGKQNSTLKIIVDTKETEGIEEKLNRTKQFKATTRQDNIAFEDETHKYHHPKDETGNAEYISVTTLIDRFFPFDMDRFIQGKAKREGRSEEDVLDEFIKNRDEAAEKGTYLHEQIENFLNKDDYDANSKEFKMFKEFHKQIIVAKGFEFVEAEKRVFLDEYNVAGTIDALFKKPNKEEYLIVDWKRSKKLVVDGHPKKYGYGYALSELSHLDNSSYYKYALQQNIYRYILETKYHMPVSSMNLIVLHEKFDTFHRVNLVNMDKEVSIIFNSINHKI